MSIFKYTRCSKCLETFIILVGTDTQSYYAVAHLYGNIYDHQINYRLLLVISLN